jgi:ABC-type phosphate/phosphonate transport system permease subunit
MIWALFFVAVFGPGALAGVFAVAVHSIGFTGKFLSEAIEEAKPGPIEALTATGAAPLAILLKGYWPQVKPALLNCSCRTEGCGKFTSAEVMSFLPKLPT